MTRLASDHELPAVLKYTTSIMMSRGLTSVHSTSAIAPVLFDQQYLTIICNGPLTFDHQYLTAIIGSVFFDHRYLTSNWLAKKSRRDKCGRGRACCAGRGRTGRTGWCARCTPGRCAHAGLNAVNVVCVCACVCVCENAVNVVG